MSTRIFLLTMLFPFCCVILKAQTHTTSSTETTNEKGGTSLTRIYKNYYRSPDSDDNGRNPCRVFLGVGTSPENGGLKVDYTIDNTPASTYGVQVGDVILSLDNVAVSSYSELTHERDKHQQGDAFTLNILRDGQKMNIQARFKECSQEDQEEVRRRVENMRPILGVYEDKDAIQGQGLVVGEIIPGKGAAAAGLQAGDVITNVDGESIYGIGGLQEALVGRKLGETVQLVYLRNGKTLKTEVKLSGARSYLPQTTSIRRDPCAVFVGVYTSNPSLDTKGVKVTGVIDNTPAKESNVQIGDVILALDDQPVNSYTQFHQERDKHQPGDAFRLTILRDGSTITVDAKFKDCSKTDAKPEIVKTTPVEQRENPSLASPETNLDVALDLFPNPTADVLTVRFEAEAIPTTVQIVDASGKLVYSNVLNRFGGFFNEQISLADQKPGIYTLTIQQGKKLISKNIVLVART